MSLFRSYEMSSANGFLFSWKFSITFASSAFTRQAIARFIVSRLVNHWKGQRDSQEGQNAKSNNIFHLVVQRFQPRMRL